MLILGTRLVQLAKENKIKMQCMWYAWKTPGSWTGSPQAGASSDTRSGSSGPTWEWVARDEWELSPANVALFSCESVRQQMLISCLALEFILKLWISPWLGNVSLKTTLSYVEIGIHGCRTAQRGSWKYFPCKSPISSTRYRAPSPLPAWRNSDQVPGWFYTNNSRGRVHLI